MKNKNKNEKGFTFVEMIMVVAIMGIFLLVAFPRVMPYFDFVKLREANFNHQSVVYSIRLWSANNDDKNITPGNFSVLNSQGQSVASYLRTYNPDYFTRYLEGTSFETTIVNTVGSEGLGATYELRNGRLTTNVFTRTGNQMIFDSLPGIVDNNARLRYIRE